MKQKTIITSSKQETERLGRELSSILRGGAVLALHGDLGSGKTTFSQGIAAGLGVTTRVISPTFLLVREYDLSSNNRKLYHIDLYRTSDEQDVKGIGIEEILADERSIVIIEWPEKITELLPHKTKHIYFEYIDEQKRRIHVENND